MSIQGSVTMRLSVLKEGVELFADVLLPITPVSYVNSTRYTHTEGKNVAFVNRADLPCLGIKKPETQTPV